VQVGWPASLGKHRGFCGLQLGEVEPAGFLVE